MAVNSIKLEDRALAVHSFVLPSDVIVMLPGRATGSGRSLCCASLPYAQDILWQPSGHVDVHVVSITPINALITFHGSVPRGIFHRFSVWGRDY